MENLRTISKTLTFNISTSWSIEEVIICLFDHHNCKFNKEQIKLLKVLRFLIYTYIPNKVLIPKTQKF
jgi:hypothetical protein